MIADDDIADGIVDAGPRFDNIIVTKTELTVGWCVHPDRTVYHGVSAPVLVKGSQHSDIPSRPCLHLIHDEPVYKAL
jgi:hypothetical protein